VALDDSHTQLPCGVELEALLAQITDDAPGTDPGHEAGCAYCQTALRGLRDSWSDLQTFARAPVPIPPRLTGRIMRRVRDITRRATSHLILTEAHGQTQISHHVIAEVARRAALTVPGVLFASALPRSIRQPQPGTAGISLTVRLVTTYGPPLHAVAAAVRTALHRRVSSLTGAHVDRIDVAITDITAPGA
jgi:uncharacterized alkaline shock family protein YloU